MGFLQRALTGATGTLILSSRMSILKTWRSQATCPQSERTAGIK